MRFSFFGGRLQIDSLPHWLIFLSFQNHLIIIANFPPHLNTPSGIFFQGTILGTYYSGLYPWLRCQRIVAMFSAFLAFTLLDYIYTLGGSLKFESTTLLVSSFTGLAQEEWTLIVATHVLLLYLHEYAERFGNF